MGEDILFINPPSTFMVKPKYMPPLGLLSLISSLRRKGFTVGLKDLVDTSLDDGFGLDLEEAQYFGVGGVTCQREGIKKIVDQIRQNFPKAKIIGGGVDVTVSSNLHDLFDVIVRGEGEWVLPDLLCGKGGDFSGKILSKEPGDLNELPIPDYDLAEGYERKTIQTWRGCPFNCKFCAQKTLWPGETRFFPLSYVEEVARRLRGQYVGLIDEMATFPRGRALKIAKIFERYGIKWDGQTRSDMTYSSEYLKALRECGLQWLSIGLESGSQRILDLMEKRITVDETRYAVEHIKTAGLKFKLFVMRGFPGETQEEWEKTVDLVGELQPDDIRLFDFVPIPGSRINEEEFLGNQKVSDLEKKTFSDYDSEIRNRYFLEMIQNDQS